MSLSTAKDDLYGLLCSDVLTGSPAGSLFDLVARVYRGEPRAGGMDGPVAVTVTTDGMTAVEYRFAVRVYAKPDTDAQASQDVLDESIEAVERLLDDTSSQFTRGDWSVGYDANNDVFVGLCTTVCLRDDF